MTKVFLRPDAATIKANNGIGRVVHAQYKYLPQYDIELVGNEDSADVISGHTHDYGSRRIDVCHIHGLYWLGDPGSGEYNNWHKEANKRIIESMRRARAITTPSQWVGECIRRDMRLSPTVIGHGIDFQEWTPGDNDGYVLWGKNRLDDVCNPQWALELAQRKVKVFSTFAPKSMAEGDKPYHLTVTGELSADSMKEYLRHADVYLATTKETFGIQTLEALACGVPVLGFDWGGTADIVEHKHTGYLVRPSDTDGLMEGLAYIRAHRLELSVNARAHASNFTWERVIQRYAELYHSLAHTPDYTGVAVVIPCHNYGKYLGACLDSVIAQTYEVDEIIVVDDGSTDDSREVAGRYPVTLLKRSNSGVAATRNSGIAHTGQPLIVCLDADDMLDPRYIASCRDAMLRDRGLGITFTGMSILKTGQPPSDNVWKIGDGFDWEWQATPRNPPATHIPTGAMFRRSMWERAGGYKQQYAPGEDAEFYTRGLSVGFTAKQVTDAPWYLYRDHGEGAHKRLPYRPIDDWLPWMRDREYPLAAPAEVAPNVRSYSDPKVTVIIPVGPGHDKYLPDALESLLGQTMREWEVIVVEDLPFDDEIGIGPAVRRFPFARVLATEMPGNRGPGQARNVGLANAKAPLVLFLDADDQLAPNALSQMCRLYAESEGRYIYGDWQVMGNDVVHHESEYQAATWLEFAQPEGKHSVTVLMATEDARRLKFDESMAAWEDWDFFTRAALSGVQGRRLAAVTLYYRLNESRRTSKVISKGQPTPIGYELLAELGRRYGGSTMAKSCCGGNADALLAARRGYEGTPAEKGSISTVNRTTKGRGSAPMGAYDPNAVAYVRMEFIGTRSGAVTYPGARGSGRTYRAGRNPTNRFHNVHPGDVATLEGAGEFRRTAPAVVDHIPMQMPVQPSPLSNIQAGDTVSVTMPGRAEAIVQTVEAVTEAGVVKMAVGGPQLETIPIIGTNDANSNPVAEMDGIEFQGSAEGKTTFQTINDASGKVTRKRASAKKATTRKALKDLPPLG